MLASTPVTTKAFKNGKGWLGKHAIFWIGRLSNISNYIPNMQYAGKTTSHGVPWIYSEKMAALWPCGHFWVPRMQPNSTNSNEAYRKPSSLQNLFILPALLEKETHLLHPFTHFGTYRNAPPNHHRKFPQFRRFPTVNRLWVPRNKDMERMDIGKPLDSASLWVTTVKLSCCEVKTP